LAAALEREAQRNLQDSKKPERGGVFALAAAKEKEVEEERRVRDAERKEAEAKKAAEAAAERAAFDLVAKEKEVEEERRLARERSTASRLATDAVEKRSAFDHAAAKEKEIEEEKKVAAAAEKPTLARSMSSVPVSVLPLSAHLYYSRQRCRNSCYPREAHSCA
jgi:hypothetical protein